jgi:hypothetical protein
MKFNAVFAEVLNAVFAEVLNAVFAEVLNAVFAEVFLGGVFRSLLREVAYRSLRWRSL